MIRVHRPADAPNVLLTEGARKTKEDCAAYDSEIRNFDFDRDIYGHPDVKEALVAMHYGKCCYCESKVRHVTAGDIDHYRPKKASQQSKGEPLLRPGYYWLAYDWQNLLFICPACNQSHKRNFFPLANPSQRARSHHDDLSREKPLLVDPTRENPDDFVRYREEVLYAVNDNPRGRATIAILGLNERNDLIERRRERLAILKTLQNVAQLRPGTKEAAEAELMIQQLISEQREYSAMVRAALNAKK